MPDQYVSARSSNGVQEWMVTIEAQSPDKDGSVAIVAQNPGSVSKGGKWICTDLR